MNNNIEKEVWKDIEGYEGIYKVSNKGRVWSCKRRIERKQQINEGYKTLKLSKGGKDKTVSVHRLVANAFIDNPQNKPEVNHLDEDKANNYANNLVWCTSKENANWGTRNKRISEYVKANPVSYYKDGVMRSSRKIKKIDPTTNEVVKVYDSVTEASRINGFHQGNISSCCAGRIHTSRGYKWEYVV